jgi:hypothetical protein
VYGFIFALEFFGLIYVRKANFMKCTVKLVWDSDVDRWYTETDDIPGLVLEEESFDKLVDRVRLAAPEMLELNRDYTGPVYISFEAERIEKVS